MSRTIPACSAFPVASSNPRRRPVASRRTPCALRLALLAGALASASCAHLPHLPKLPPKAPPPPTINFAAVTPEPVKLPLDPSLLKPTDAAYRVGPGDKLDIEMMGDVATRSTATVGPDGKVYYYILPGIDVWGLTIPEIRDRLATELRRYVRDQAAVTVSLKEAASQHVWMLGRVSTPGVYTLSRPTTLLDAIAQAGGLSSTSPAGGASAGGGAAASRGGPEAADLSHSFVIRNGSVLPVDFDRLLRQGDTNQNIYLQSDDFVYLPSATAAEVHILGAVVQPHSQSLDGGLSLVQAIALSGGTAPGASLKNVAILRGSLSSPQLAVVDVGAIIKGENRDIRLEPNDIVYVPISGGYTLVRYANLILDTFARTVGINAGTRAAGATSVNVGVGVSSSPTASSGPAFSRGR